MYKRQVLLISAVPEPPVMMLRKGVAVSMGVPEEPMDPVPDVKLTCAVVRVTEPERVMEPEPLALREMVPLDPVDALALMAMPELLPLVARKTFEVPVMDRAPATVRVPPELTFTGLVVPEIAPRVVVLEAPLVLMVRDLAPNVIVCPEEVKAPPLPNWRL